MKLTIEEIDRIFAVFHDNFQMFGLSKNYSDI